LRRGLEYKYALKALGKSDADLTGWSEALSPIGSLILDIAPELETHNRPAAASSGSSTARPLRTGSSWYFGGFSASSRGRTTCSVRLGDLQWLDAAPLDKAVEMKVSFLRGAP
jgi:hypothetical protein